MKLVIAEKPSVAQSIAKILGATSKKDGYLEGNGYIVSWCVGHLISLASTERYNEQYQKWELSHLPLIPPTFEYEISKGKEKQVKILCNLLNRTDVECVINACDAGREGELIFRLIYNFSKSDKEVKRLWISSMEDTAIKDGFCNLKDGKDFDDLYNSALCRSRADWIVGINATRLFSCLYNQTLNVGRVMSPTLAMIVERNANINAFVSEPYYTVVAESDNVSFATAKIKDRAQAEKLLQQVANTMVVIKSVDSKEKTEKPPKLYDLTTLQREANRKLGFTANQTLEYVQSLYEKKLCTYPRTDSCFLTEDMEHSLPELLLLSVGLLSFPKEGEIDVPCNAQLVINNSKVTDHHAIIPTKTLQSYKIDNLPYGEKAVLTMIMLRLLSSLGDAHIYSETVVTATCGDLLLTAKGKTILSDGFKKYARLLKADEDTDTSLPLIAEGEVLDNIKAKIKEGKTSPPKPFTEDTLLSAMELAWQKEDVEKEFCGLGTPVKVIGELTNENDINCLGGACLVGQGQCIKGF